LLRVLRLRSVQAMQSDGDKGEEDEPAVWSHGRGLDTNLRAGFILDQAVSRVGRGEENGCAGARGSP
jgi:hypothetical protein